MPKEEFSQKLDEIKHKHKTELRCLLILLFYTGCRPSEAVQLTPKNFFIKDKKTLWVMMPTTKGGEPGLIPLSLKNPHIQELTNYVFGYAPAYYLFQHFISRGLKYRKEKLENGEIIKIPYKYETTRKIRHWVYKFFSIPPYFFRHNRFTTSAIKGATLRQLMMLKRAKNEKSVYPYLHFSIKEKAQLKRFTD
jgi:integrase